MTQSSCDKVRHVGLELTILRSEVRELERTGRVARGVRLLQYMHHILFTPELHILLKIS
jgi:hypothetical protein